MSNISDTLEENLALQGTEEDSGIISLRRSNTSKNITSSDWNQLVQGAAVSVADLERLYRLLGDIIPKIDGTIATNSESIDSHESRIDAIEPVATDAVRRSLSDDSVQEISGTISPDAIDSESADFENLTVHNTISMDGATQLANDAIDTETLRTDYIAANFDNVGNVINILSGMLTKAITASGTITAPDMRTAKILPNNTSVQLGDESIEGFEVQIKGKASVSTDLDVGGNLNIKGKPINQVQESIIVEDNFIVTNSSGAEFSTSGLAIRLEGASNAAYGIYYDPDTKVVMISEGTLSGDIGDVEFTPTPGKAVPLAARDGFDVLRDSNVPAWDKSKNAFLPSKIKFLTTDSGTTVLGGKVAIPSDEGGSVPVMDGTIEYGIMFGENLTAERDITVNPIKHVNLMGVGLKQIADDQSVRGKYNFPKINLFYMLGNGRDDNQRSNAVSVKWDGTMFVANEVYVCGDNSRGTKGHGADPYGTGDYAPKRLATEAYVDEQLGDIAKILNNINNGGSTGGNEE